uniref:Uncharacterized protein n=1 Tax=Pipistrellus kuhlii TaxID=59472 RepID=A0A7J7QTC7_PIPKU|nr:hypothetical protein mPipKuh1_008595 [Pipistrellus kuhlii]
MREKHPSAASCTPTPPSTGDVPTTKVHALDQNRIRDPSVPRLMFYPLSHTGFGLFIYFIIFFKSSPGDIFPLIFFLEREGKRERNVDVRETHGWAVSGPGPRAGVQEPATQVRALDRNRTRDPAVRRLTLYPLSHTGQGSGFGHGASAL